MASVTPLRITGMSSGIDTDGIIQSMLKIQQLKVDREIRSRINLQWKQDGLKQINADITEFRNTYLSTLSSKNVFSSATFNTRTVSAVGSNSGAISVTAGADAALGTFTINAVTSLASGANVKSTGGTVSAVSSDGQGLRDLGLDKTLGQLNWSRSAGLTGGSLTVNGGAAITYDSDTTLKSLTEQFDMAGYTLSISGDKFTLTANDGGAVDVTADTGNLTTLLGFASEHATKGVTGGMLTQSSDRATITGATLLTDIAGTGTGTVEFSVNGTTISLDNSGGAKTVQDLVNAVNAQSSTTKATMKLNANGSFTVKSTVPGQDVALDGTNDKSGLLVTAWLDNITTTNQEQNKVLSITSFAGNTTGKVSSDGKGFLSGGMKISQLNFTSGLNFDANGEIYVEINGASVADAIVITKDTTLQQFINEVNSNSKANATLTYDGLSDTFKLESKTMGGTANTLAFSDSGGLFTAMKLTGALVNTGTPAKIELADGTTITRDSNTFTANGITFQLNATTTQPTTFEVKQDVSGTVEKIKGFVDAYNSLVGKLNKLVSESKTTSQRQYTPLTDTDKTGMSESEIKLWEDTAKIGMFRNDAGLTSMLNNLRSALYTKVEGTGLSPADIGLGTFGFSSGSGWRERSGQIDLDTEKLKAALEKDPEAVTNVFTAIAPTGSSVGSTGANGIASTKSGLFSTVISAFSSYEKNFRFDALSNVTDQLNKQIKRVGELEDKIVTLSESYYKKFAAMESAVAKLQEQQSSIAGLLSASSK